jgi:cell division protein ZapA
MKTIEVDISGQRYKIRSDEQEEYIASLATYVNQQIDQIRQKSKSMATQSVAVLAALNIADELFKTRQRRDLLKQQMKERIRRIIKMIENER